MFWDFRSAWQIDIFGCQPAVIEICYLDMITNKSHKKSKAKQKLLPTQCVVSWLCTAVPSGPFIRMITQSPNYTTLSGKRNISNRYSRCNIITIFLSCASDFNYYSYHDFMRSLWESIRLYCCCRCVRWL
jgi:hypothetical protein